jgi:hypothetical protein
MNTYIYQAALWCESCTNQIKTWGHLTETSDSDKYPHGPYGDGGGESDTPQHCDGCEVFLQNPLTSDGYDYIVEAIGDSTVALTDTQRLWSDFYLD